MAQVSISGVGGSIVTFRPLTKAAKAWFDDNVSSESWQWMGGGALAVDARYADNLTEGLADQGLL